jgi:hypothetical protein
MPSDDDPTLSWLAVNSRGLRFRCIACSTSRTLSPLEAIASYGGLVRFSELRAIIKGRCEARLKAKCDVLIGPTTDAYSAPNAKRASGDV